jgi:hypothetical protein
MARLDDIFNINICRRLASWESPKSPWAHRLLTSGQPNDSWQKRSTV